MIKYQSDGCDPNLFVHGDTLYFRANDGIRGAELWKTDGTEAGTQLVADINPLGGHSNPHGYQIVNGRLVRLPSRGWSLVAALIVAVGIQLLRDRRGAFDLAAFAAVALGLTAIAMFALSFNLVLIPIVSLLTAAVLSALLRETVESRAARRERRKKCK